MTRGRIVILTDTKVLESVEFNGEMQPKCLGAEIIQAYKEGKLTTEESFIEFLRAFNEKNFGYYEDTLWTEKQLNDYRPQDTIAKHADYTYIINNSNKGFISTSCRPQTMCVYGYRKNKPSQIEQYISEELKGSQKLYLRGVIVNAIALANLSNKEALNLLTEIEKEYR